MLDTIAFRIEWFLRFVGVIVFYQEIIVRSEEKILQGAYPLDCPYDHLT